MNVRPAGPRCVSSTRSRRRHECQGNPFNHPSNEIAGGGCARRRVLLQRLETPASIACVAQGSPNRMPALVRPSSSAVLLFLPAIVCARNAGCAGAKRRAVEDKLAGMCLLISRRLAHSDLCMACQATWGWRPAGGDAPQRMQVIRCARPRRVPVVPCPCALRCVAATKAGLGAFFVCRRERSDDAMCRFRLRTPQLRRQRVRHISSNCRVSVGTRERFASPCKTLMGDWEC